MKSGGRVLVPSSFLVSCPFISGIDTQYGLFVFSGLASLGMVLGFLRTTADTSGPDAGYLERRIVGE